MLFVIIILSFIMFFRTERNLNVIYSEGHRPQSKSVSLLWVFVIRKYLSLNSLPTVFYRYINIFKNMLYLIKIDLTNVTMFKNNTLEYNISTFVKF